MKSAALSLYLERARNLTSEELAAVLMRTGSRKYQESWNLPIDDLKVVAIQLEVEDEQIADWRKMVATLRVRENYDSPTIAATTQNAESLSLAMAE